MYIIFICGGQYEIEKPSLHTYFMLWNMMFYQTKNYMPLHMFDSFGTMSNMWPLHVFNSFGLMSSGEVQV